MLLCVTACRQRLRKHAVHGVACVRVSLFFFMLLKKAGSSIKEVDAGGVMWYELWDFFLR